MIIQVQANLTEEQALILATKKWYCPTITQNMASEETKVIQDPMTWLDVTVPVSYSDVEASNPQTAWEFIKNVYEEMIKQDAIKTYIEYDRELLANERETKEQAIKDEVIASISSSIG